MLRVTGRVVRVERKQGTKVNEQTGEARDWAFDIIRVLVAGQDIVEVQSFAGGSFTTPAVGADVDLAVTVESYRNKVGVQVDQPWADLFPKTAPAPVRAAV